jgi:hypothetical protein
MSSPASPGAPAPTVAQAATQAATTIQTSNSLPAGAPALSDPLIQAILAKMPPLGTHWDDDDRRSWLHLWIESVNLVYHQSESDMSVTTAPPAPAPAPAPAPTDGSSNGSSTSSDGSAPALASS